ncbi:dipeptide ABC transporter ATP-binding protein [Arthrobacter sp. UCD-GKA]|uniref:ABC transporter ATP-binding protein n=1 Tax=Arthrobacter sp. UCD-GKA TaxID=1913576 RepID=UPI0025710985|nr:dipeptide ABC transporter ATP-binding protein [Arthrobacter sp. UCD-GKA]
MPTPSTSTQTLPGMANHPACTPLMEMRDVKQHYAVHRHLPIGPRKFVKALDGVDLSVHAGETLGVIGESGCGKSTLARVMAGLEKPTQGQVFFRGEDINTLRGDEKKEMRRNIQLIFQDPYSSLNPRMTVEQLVSEPYEIHPEVAPKAGRKAKIKELLELVGLNPNHSDRYPHNFSGGQQQRIGIARGIALNPKMLICDEPVSALDVSVRAQVVNLLDDLQKELGLSYLFIAHDLQIVRHISDRVATMYLGRVVELGTYSDVYDSTAQPYTRALMSAAPELRRNDGNDREKIILQGDPPSPIDPPAGCRFHTRCPMAQAICATREPELIAVGDSHEARCHFAKDLAAEFVQRAGA